MTFNQNIQIESNLLVYVTKIFTIFKVPLQPAILFSSTQKLFGKKL